MPRQQSVELLRLAIGHVHNARTLISQCVSSANRPIGLKHRSQLMGPLMFLFEHLLQEVEAGKQRAWEPWSCFMAPPSTYEWSQPEQGFVRGLWFCVYDASLVGPSSRVMSHRNWEDDDNDNHYHTSSNITYSPARRPPSPPPLQRHTPTPNKQ